MFKQIRKESQAVGAAEIQIQAPPGSRLPPWVPTPEGGVFLDRYSNFMSFEENYTHSKDLKYSLLLKHDAVLELFKTHSKLPAHRLFDLELIEEKIKLLREITHKTKVTSLDTRLVLEKKLNRILDSHLPAGEEFDFLSGLTPGVFKIDLGLKYKLSVVFSTPQDRELSSEIISLKKRYLHALEEEDVVEIAEAWRAFHPALMIFQKKLSTRLIQAYDFGLKVRISLTDLEERFKKINDSSAITLEHYQALRTLLFKQGRDARDVLFKVDSK
jgi:hypothetical protein